MVEEPEAKLSKVRRSIIKNKNYGPDRSEISAHEWNIFHLSKLKLKQFYRECWQRLVYCWQVSKIEPIRVLHMECTCLIQNPWLCDVSPHWSPFSLTHTCFLAELPRLLAVYEKFNCDKVQSGHHRCNFHCALVTFKLQCTFSKHCATYASIRITY